LNEALPQHDAVAGDQSSALFIPWLTGTDASPRLAPALSSCRTRCWLTEGDRRLAKTSEVGRGTRVDDRV